MVFFATQQHQQDNLLCTASSFPLPASHHTTFFPISATPHMLSSLNNNTGVVLNAIGMRPSFDRVLQRYAHALGALFFGDTLVRPTHIGPDPAHLHDLGGASLDEHHTFIVRYTPEQDRELEMHVDDCDVTFNFGLSDPNAFDGSDLVFCGMAATPQLRQLVHTYSHSKGLIRLTNAVGWEYGRY